ncbi:hypothetical protein PFISCL1PPCAC_4058, partial [Pristionchus fissidentatus]
VTTENFTESALDACNRTRSIFIVLSYARILSSMSQLVDGLDVLLASVVPQAPPPAKHADSLSHSVQSKSVALPPFAIDNRKRRRSNGRFI